MVNCKTMYLIQKHILCLNKCLLKNSLHQNRGLTFALHYWETSLGPQNVLPDKRIFV